MCTLASLANFISYVHTMLGRVREYADHRILTFYELRTHKDKRDFSHNSHYIYHTLFMVESTEAVVFIKEDQLKGILGVSLRSKDRLNVASFAKDHYGGGGHKNAAGFRVPLALKSREELEKEVVAQLEEELEKLKD
ncbi:UNVERIFIED_CONTAM: hypothetical protein PYX00_011937 [Menopon gallinae]|uniref:DHHA1 domain-containing protein n=1 Tax=Menopon gallinae TaxID=328185 RepID=A0AAW2H8T2_9NEOP